MACFNAKKVRKLRRDLEETQQQFAERLGVGVATIHRWESGETHPSPLAQRLLHALVLSRTPAEVKR